MGKYCLDITAKDKPFMKIEVEDDKVKYKVGDIFINHNDGKILQVCEGECNKGCPYSFGNCKGVFSNNISCRAFIGNNIVKELPSLPPGTKVKVRGDLKVGGEYDGYIFNYEMEPYTEVTISCYDTAYNSYQVFENFNHYSLEMFDQVINEPKENNMETKEIKIKVPEGYEIDEENSALDCIKFKLIKKELTYKDVVEKLFNNNILYYINERGRIINPNFAAGKEDKNNATNKKQLERLLALNQLLNIAEYYNKKSPKEENYIYCINFEGRNFKHFVLRSTKPRIERGLVPEFNRAEDAKAVINNPNFKEILDLVYKGDED